MSSSAGDPPVAARIDTFRALRRRNQRRARIARLTEAQRERRLKIERVVQTQRQHRLRRAG
jgi:hypothetical protein